MIKWFALSLVLVLMLIPVAGFAQSDVSGDITFLSWRYQEDDLQWQELMAAFNERYPDVNVTAVYSPDAEYEQKVATMMAGNIPLDVMWMKNPYAVAFGDRGLLEDLNPWVEQSGLDLTQYFQDGIHEPGPEWWEGKLYALNAVTMSYFYFFNKDLFDEAGIAYPTNDWTMEEYLDIAEQLTDLDTHQYGTNVRPWYGSYFVPWIWAFGGDWYAEDYSRVLWDTPETIAAHQFIADLINEYQVAPTLDMQETVGIDFSSQRIAMFYSGSWDISGTEREPSKWPFRWGAVLPPHGPEGQHPLVHTNAVSMSTRSQNKEAAWAFIEWFIGKEAQMIIAEHGDFPAHIEAAEEAAFLHMEPQDREVVFAAANEGSLYRLGTPANPAVARIWVNYRDRIFLGQLTAEEALTQAAQEANEALQRLHTPPRN